MSDSQVILDEVLSAVQDDWVAEVEIYSLCLEAMSEEAGHDPDPVDVRAAAIEVAAGGVEQGLLVAGDLTRSGFVAWDLSPQESVARLREAWLGAAQPDVNWGEVAWFDSTEAGDVRAGQSTSHS